MERFKKYYDDCLSYYLVTKSNTSNPFSVSKLKAIVVHITSKDVLPSMLALELITGQKPRRILAKHSISGFKLRKGMVVGCKVTLRGDEMYRFLNILVTLIFPKLEHFVTEIESLGNYTFGIPDIFIFNELESEYDQFSKFLTGLEITFVSKDSKNKNIFTGFKIPIDEKAHSQR